MRQVSSPIVCAERRGREGGGPGRGIFIGLSAKKTFAHGDSFPTRSIPLNEATPKEKTPDRVDFSEARGIGLAPRRRSVRAGSRTPKAHKFASGNPEALTCPRQVIHYRPVRFPS